MDNITTTTTIDDDLEYLAFLEERKKYDLTSSEFAAALGLDKYKSRQKLWREKTGRKTLSEMKENNFSDFNCTYGRENEERGVARFAEKMPLYEIRKSPTLPINYGFLLDSRDLLIDYALGSSPDRTLHDKETGELLATLEVKTPAPMIGFYGRPPREAQVYSCTKEGRVSSNHLVQMIGQMKATNVSQSYYQVWTPTNGDATIKVVVSESFWQHIWEEVILKELFIFLDWVTWRIEPPKLTRGEKEFMTKLLYDNVKMQLI